MADNTVLNTGTGGDTIASDDIGPGVKYQRIKLTLGADGVNDGDVASGNPMPVNVSSALPAGANNIGDVDVLTIAAGDNNIGNVDVLTVPAPLSTTGTGTEATALRVTVATDSTGVLSVDDNGASLTVDGTVDTELTTADLDTGAGTDTRAVVGLVRAESGGGTLVGSANPLPVDVIAALPAGANNIGDVDILSIAAGDNNIGNVDIVTMPSVTIGTFPDNEPFNVAQINGVAPLMGAGNTGTGSPRVTIASDQAAVAVTPAGNVAHDAVDSGNPIKIGGRADTTFQAVVAAADRVDALFDVYGQLRTRTDHANNWSYHENSSSALTDTVVKAAPGVGMSVYITDIVVSTGAATALNVFFEEGTTTILGPYYLEAVAGRGLVIHFRTPKKCTANTAVTITTSAAIAHGIDVMGFVAP